MIDLDTLPPPAVVETLSFEAIFSAARDDLAQRLRPHLPDIDAILQLESDPLAKLLQAHTYRELLYRARVNDAARAHLIAYAKGADLEHRAAEFNVARMADEGDERLRMRLLLRIAAMAGNGTKEHYEYMAMTASGHVKAAYATSPEPGRVQVLLWIVAGATPDERAAAVQACAAVLQGEESTVLGIPVAVAVARPRTIDVHARIALEPGASADLLPQLQAAMVIALEAFARIGRPVARSFVTSLLHRQGVASVTYPDPNRPQAVTTLAADEYPVAGVIQLDYAGVVA